MAMLGRGACIGLSDIVFPVRRSIPCGAVAATLRWCRSRSRSAGNVAFGKGGVRVEQRYPQAQPPHRQVLPHAARLPQPDPAEGRDRGPVGRRRAVADRFRTPVVLPVRSEFDHRRPGPRGSDQVVVPAVGLGLRQEVDGAAEPVAQQEGLAPEKIFAAAAPRRGGDRPSREVGGAFGEGGGDGAAVVGGGGAPRHQPSPAGAVRGPVGPVGLLGAAQTSRITANRCQQEEKSKAPELSTGGGLPSSRIFSLHFEEAAAIIVC
mmetsp:Transcript_46348/g.90516  ORF Transcript_46348/g.90516 Transcript_46348/m.90516 type:complete len:263 (-) Transcript_46348:163-951(-)